MPQPLVILGASGNAYDVLDVVDAINARTPTWEVLGLLDDSRPAGTRFASFKILGGLADAVRFDSAFFVNAIGSDRSFSLRPKFVSTTGIPTERFATLVHPQASVSPRARLGYGVCVNPGVCLAGNTAIGNHVSLGPGSIVGHDSVIEDHAMLAPGAIVSGFCRLETACYIGAGAVIRQHVRIGARALVGMGAVVLRNVEKGAIVIGNPAHVLERPAMQVN